jgi:hypothetical protein
MPLPGKKDAQRRLRFASGLVLFADQRFNSATVPIFFKSQVFV